MATLEQVEKLRERAQVSFEEAKAALDAADGDLLDAMIYLEKQGRVTPPGGGYYSGAAAGAEESGAGEAGRGETRERPRKERGGGERFSDTLRRFGRFALRLLQKGNTNFFEVEKNGGLLLSLPVTALVLLLICFFWVTIPLLIIGLFFGLRYSFRGYDLGREDINKALGDASAVVEDMKDGFKKN